MHFRIPQTLHGYETAAREGGLVSQQAFASATAQARADLSSLQPNSRSARDDQVDAILNEESSVQLYYFLCHLDGERGLKASQLQLVARTLSSAGLSAAKQNQASSNPHHGTALSLSIFFTCQMLQRVEVSACTCAAHLLLQACRSHGCVYSPLA